MPRVTKTLIWIDTDSAASPHCAKWMIRCHTFYTDQIFHHAPWNSCVATHRTHKLQAPNASRVGDSQGRLQDPVCQWDQVRFLCHFLFYPSLNNSCPFQKVCGWWDHVPFLVAAVYRNEAICFQTLVCDLLCASFLVLLTMAACEQSFSISAVRGEFSFLILNSVVFRMGLVFN